jgi:16S rRNA processing protein RimM
MGVIGRPHGVRGLAHVHSYTANPVDLASYAELKDEAGQAFRLRWVAEGIAEIAHRNGAAWQTIDNRDAIARLTNRHLYVDRAAMPPPPEDEYYLADLVGLTAFNGETALGQVVIVHDYGAGVSLEIAREAAAPLLIPFTRAAVPMVDIANGHLQVCPPVEVLS